MYHKETGSSGAERKMGFLQGIKIWSYWTTVSFFCSLCLLSSSSSPRRHFSPTVILIAAQEYDAVSLHHSDHPPSFKSNIFEHSNLRMSQKSNVQLAENEAAVSVSQLCLLETDIMNQTTPSLQIALDDQRDQAARVNLVYDFCNEDLRCILNYTEAFSPEYKYACQDNLQRLITLEVIMQCEPPFVNRDTLFHTVYDFPLCVSEFCTPEEGEALILPFVDEILNNTQSELRTFDCRIVRISTGANDIPDSVPTPDDICFRDTELVVKKESLVEATDITDKAIAGVNIWDFCAGIADNCVFEIGPNNYQRVQDECLALEQGLFVNLEFVLECFAEVEDQLFNLRFNSTRQPYCVSNTCTSAMFGGLLPPRATQWTDELLSQAWNCTVISQTMIDPFSNETQTISPAPTLSFSPTVSPTVSLEPTMEPECLGDSILLNETSRSLQLLLQQVQDEMDAVPFGSYCVFPVDVLAVPYIVECDLDYAIPARPVQLVQEVCQALGQAYVENTYMIACTDDTTETYITHRNRPSCRSNICIDGNLTTQDIDIELEALIQVDIQWLLDGITRDDGLECSITDVQLLYGDGLIPPLELNETCYNATLIDIDQDFKVNNSMTVLRNQFVEDLNPPGDNCNSTNPEDTECIVDFEKYDAQRLIDTCGDAFGDLVQYDVLLECQKQGAYLSVDAKAVKRCIGKPCTEEEVAVHIERTEDLAEELTNQGFQCSMSISNIERFELVLVTPSPTQMPQTIIPTTPQPSFSDGNGGGLTWSGRENIFGKDEELGVDIIIIDGSIGDLSDRLGGRGGSSSGSIVSPSTTHIMLIATATIVYLMFQQW